jgi:hypothetical protein
MNQSFYEVRGKEKLRELLKEGQTSQAYYRSRPKSPSLLSLLRDVLLRSLMPQPGPTHPRFEEPDSRSIRTRYGE